MNRDRYPVSVMCQFFEVSRSGYYDFFRRIGYKEKDADLAEMIRVQQERSFKTYGCRRMWMWLKKQGIHSNPKAILRIMKKYELLADIRRRRKWVQMGQQTHKYENLLNRQFQASRPNSKWVTDISYIQTKEGVLFLFMIRDLRMCRSIQVEGAFALLKNDFGFRRFLTKGKANVRTEMFFLALAFNLKKLWMKRAKGRLQTHLSEIRIA